MMTSAPVEEDGTLHGRGRRWRGRRPTNTTGAVCFPQARASTGAGLDTFSTPPMWKTGGWRAAALEASGFPPSIHALCTMISTQRSQRRRGLGYVFRVFNAPSATTVRNMTLDCSSRNNAPPWSSADAANLVARVRRHLSRRAQYLGTLPVRQLGGLEDFIGYTADELVEHLERRWLQGCLICGRQLEAGVGFEVCHIDPREAHDGAELVELMRLTNLGLSHISCNRRLGLKPIR